MKRLITLTIEGQERHYTMDFFLRHRIDWFEADGEKTKIMLGGTPAGSMSPLLIVDQDMSSLLALFSGESAPETQQDGFHDLLNSMSNPEAFARSLGR